MKKLSLLLLASFIIFSCQQKQEGGVKLSAKVDVPDNTKVYLSVLNEQAMPEVVDTVEVMNGAFEMPLPNTDFQQLSILRLDNVRGNIIFINENKPLHVSLYKDSLRSSVVKGSKQNEVFEGYLEHMKDMRKEMEALRKEMEALRKEEFSDPAELQKQIKEKRDLIAQKDTEIRKKIIQENPNSLVSILMLSDLVNMKTLPSTETKALFESLSKDAQESAIGKKINESFQAAAVAAAAAASTEVGAKAPEFSAPTPEGNQLALKDAMGKITLIDFWASWCKPCRIANPEIVKLYEKFHDKGFNILGVSLDRPGQKDKWIKAIEDDGLTWPQVSNLQFWQGPIAKLYGIRSIPATYILDENGIIVAKNLRGKALEDKIAELLEEK
ncbi:peroxiredoxin [Mesonia hippocampi]|uniref:Peroxiredoxin n=1 Tax=Mesonia hippocampi TaxID=1628250 RepID=A0A840ERS3_9FLAO|nr:redoxin domain-containing protein [Mesonia hippocampi]MBB4118056.1 peroxiredoxin [Mesonia hippocampi]